MKTRIIFLAAFLTVLLCFYNLSEALSADKAKFSKVYSEKGISINGVETVNSISFNVAVPDIGISEVNGEDGVTYHKISIPDSAFLTEKEGAPQIPYISELIQLPANASNVSISTSLNTNPKIYNEISIYPCPRKVIKTTIEGYKYIAEEFYIDPAKYNNNDTIPKVYAEIAEDGYFRSIRMARINIYPLRYTASERVLEFASELTVTITWTTEPKDISKKDTTKGFEKLISNVTLNDAAYMKIEQPDSSTRVSIKAESPEIAGASAGSVRYITGAELRDMTINCDYLIITHQNFFSSPELASFANYRATYSELNVVVAKTEDIYAQFPNGNGNDYSIKDFVQYAYSNWQTAPQYLLIVGDVGYVPTHPGQLVYDEPIDYEEWYACVSGADEWPDMAMGRFPVGNTSDITAIKDKVVSYEQSPVIPNDYHKRALFLEGTYGNEPRVLNVLANSGFELTELYFLNYATSWDATPAIPAINYGQNLVFYLGHGNTNGINFLYESDISSLTNYGMYPIMLTTACRTARLSVKLAFGEQIVVAKDKGAVAYYGATVLSGPSASYETLVTIFDNFEYSLGKDLLFGEIFQNYSAMSKEYILLGDPALRVFGYGIGHGLPDLTLSSSGVSYDHINHRLTIEAKNIGDTGANAVVVRAFIVDDVTGAEYPFSEYTFPFIAAGSSAATIIEQAPPFRGEFNIIARVDPDNTINESNELNNQNGKRNMMNPTFVDVTDGSGIVWEDPCGSSPNIVKADVNKDGYEDIYIARAYDNYYYPKLLLNNGDGTFRDVTGSSNLGNQFARAEAFGDINNDGYPDLCLGSGTGNKLLLNNGDGTFSDITASSGIGGRSCFRQITFGDVNNDGYLDLYVITQDNANILFINNGDNSFTDETTARGLNRQKTFSKKPAFVDYDNDGDLDLLAFCPSAEYPAGHPQLFFYINDGGGVFSEKTVLELINPPSPPPSWWYATQYHDFQPEKFVISDIDLDGDLDLIVFSDTRDMMPYLVRYYKNDGAGKFELVVEADVNNRIYDMSGYSSYVAEIDNMPGEDLIWAKYFIRNSDKGTFMRYEDISCGESYDYDILRETSIPIDIDGDGDNDIIRIAMYGFVQVLQNQVNNNDWLKVKPVGVGSNRDAIGAKVHVYSSGGELVGFQEVSCEKPAPLHFGVDSLDTYKIVVRWPGNGTTSIIESVSPAQTITVIEGGTLPTPPASPSALTAAAVSQSQINLTWHDNSGDEDCFKIECGTDGVNFSQIATVGRNLTAYSDSPLIPDTTYYYRVRAYNIGGNSAYSNIASTTTLPSNRPPVLDPIGDKAIDEGKLLEFRVTASDPDNDAIELFADPLPQGATFEKGAFGWVFRWIPTYEQSGNYRVTFIASDGQVKTIETITITVNNVNRPPILDPIGDKTTDEGKTLEFRVTATDPDGDPILLSAKPLPPGATFENNTFSWTPGFTQAGTYTVTFNAEEALVLGLSDTETITITVNNVNGPPVLDPIGNKTVNRGEWLRFTVHATDPDGDRITYYIVNKPQGASFDSKTGYFTWKPNARQAGKFNVTFIAKDSKGNQSSETITITVPNRPPVLEPIGNKTVNAGKTLTFKLKAKDPDPIDNSSLVFYAQNLPRGAYLSTNGIFIWKPTPSQRGLYNVRFYVRDLAGATDDEAITITVTK